MSDTSDSRRLGLVLACFSVYETAPFTTQTLIAASRVDPDLRAALRRAAPDRFSGISANALTRALRAAAPHVLPSGDGIWRIPAHPDVLREVATVTAA